MTNAQLKAIITAILMLETTKNIFPEQGGWSLEKRVLIAQLAADAIIIKMGIDHG
jgi:hypothetical protein